MQANDTINRGDVSPQRARNTALVWTSLEPFADLVLQPALSVEPQVLALAELFSQPRYAGARLLKRKLWQGVWR